MYTQLANRVDITPTAGSEQPVDLSASIPVGATGVTLYLKNSSPNGQLCGACHPDLTLRLGNIRNRASAFLSAGVNSSRQIKVQIATSSVTVYLVGYFDSDCTFLDDDLEATDVTPTNNTWEKVDHSSLSTSAVFAIYNISRTGDVDIGTYASSIGTVSGTDPSVTAWPASLCGTDFVPMADLGSGQYGTWLYRNGFYTVHLVGFVNAGAEVIGPTDVSTTNLSTYEAINDASDAIMIQYRGAFTAEATEDETYLSSDSAGAESMGGRPSGINSAIVATDESDNIYQYIENVDQDYFVIGRVTNAGSSPLVLDQEIAAYGDSLTWPDVGLGTLTSWTITDSQGNVVNLSNGGDLGATIPALGDDVVRGLTGTVTVTVGNGVTTATDTFTLSAPDNYTVQSVLSGFSTTPPSVYQDFGGTIQVGEQSIYSTADFNSFDGLGGAEAVGALTTTIYHVSLDGVMQSYTVIFGDISSDNVYLKTKRRSISPALKSALTIIRT